LRQERIMASLPRSSKFRHVFGTAFKRDECFENVNAQISASEVNHIAANSKYISVAWKVGGGAVAALSWDQCGKLPPTDSIPLLAGHTAEVIDFQFSPFDESLIATCSADCTIKVWQIPDGGLKTTMTDPLMTLEGHSRKVTNVEFNPVSDNVLLSAGFDQCIKLWDVTQGVEKAKIDVHPDQIQCMAWNYDGSMIATTCKDKQIRIIDPRTGQVAQTVAGHQGAKGSRCCYLGKSGRLLTTGFSKQSERQMTIWDPNTMTPFTEVNIDISSGSLMPFYDEDTQLLYMAGKGDTNMRYFELQEDAPHQNFISEYRSKDPQKGVCMLSKRAGDVMKCEISRFLFLTNNMITPVSFTVPRKGDAFQDDLFPDSKTGEPSQSSDDYFAGKNALPKYGSMQPGTVVKKDTAVRMSPAQAQAAKIADLEAKNGALEAEVAALKAKLAAAGLE